MTSDKLQLNVESLSVESFVPDGDAGYEAQSIYFPSVLGYTEAYSCEGTCGTCGGTDCYA